MKFIYSKDSVRFLENIKRLCDDLSSRLSPHISDLKMYSKLENEPNLFQEQMAISSNCINNQFWKIFNEIQKIDSHKFENDEKGYDETSLPDLNSFFKLNVVNKSTCFFKIPLLPIKKVSLRHRIENGLFDMIRKYQIDNGYDTINKFEKKVITFVHVFAKSFPIHLIPDNDHYNITRSLNIITDFVGGGDSATDCFIKQYTYQTNEIEQGTYIIVNKVDLLPDEIGNLKQYF